MKCRVRIPRIQFQDTHKPESKGQSKVATPHACVGLIRRRQERGRALRENEMTIKDEHGFKPRGPICISEFIS